MYVDILNTVKWSRFPAAHGWTFLWSTQYKSIEGVKLLSIFYQKNLVTLKSYRQPCIWFIFMFQAGSGILNRIRSLPLVNVSSEGLVSDSFFT